MIRCPECGAPVSEGETCQANLHELLYLESQALGMTEGDASEPAGLKAHFYAVAAYNLQHPQTMRLTAEALEGLRTAVREMLRGEIDIATLRARNSRAHNGSGRVTRRGNEPVASRTDVTWTRSVRDVLDAGPADYCRSVEQWAQAVVDALDDADARHSGTLNP